jgi:signal transduction histidine kinase
MEDRSSTALAAMGDAVRAIAAERSVEPVLQRIVNASRELAGARYAALGVPDGEGNFAQFITSGMSERMIAAMGPLPRTHGLLGAMLDADSPHRTSDIRQDPRFRGWWPSAHPQMSSFLGVPIRSPDGVLGALYLTDKEGGPDFTEDDERLIEMLAAHASIAIENARLYERGRELSFVEERNRLARELHDSVVQKLFGVVLVAQSASTLLERDRAGARDQVRNLQELTQDAIHELRSLIFQLRPAAVESEGLAAALAKHVQVLRRVHDQEIVLHTAGEPRMRPRVDPDVFRIAQEALHNALRHSAARHLEVRLEEGDERLALTVRDDGVGFDPAAARRLLSEGHFGLAGMRERVEMVGGHLSIDSAPGSGTTVDVEMARQGP